MGYSKVICDSIVIALIKIDEKGNINEKEFDILSNMINSAPEGMVVYETEKGYEYGKTPDYNQDKNSMTADEAWKIIESSNISKENKSKLKEFIYGKEEK